jgi:hypothetical protein
MKKKRCTFSKKSLIGTLIIVTTMALTCPPQGWAMLAPAQVSNAVHEPNVTRAADLKTIQTALESKIIRQRLTEFKLSPEQIDNRLSQLSDAQVHQTAMQIRTVSPGGDGGGGFLITVLVIAILVALFMYVFKRI